MRRGLKEQVADEVDEEIQFHLESRIEELMGEGCDRAEAERRARGEFGDLREARRALRGESTRAERKIRRTEWVHDFLQDVRYGWRRLRSRPGFAAVAILTLALGIGANTAIFSVVHAVLLRPLSYPQPDRLVRLWEVEPTGHDHNVISSGNYLDWKERASSFELLGAHSWNFGSGLIADDGQPVHAMGVGMTPNIFRMLGASAQLGRTFTTEEEVSGDVVILSHGFWQSHFGGEDDVLGRSLSVDERPVTIVGVMPPDFNFPFPNLEFWLPLQFDEEDRQERRAHRWGVVGRLKDGVPRERAQGEMDAIALRLAEEYPQYMEGWGINVQPFRSDMVRTVRPLLFVLLGVVVVVLLIACANLANLLLARAMSREREVALRGALGAGRLRLVRQFLTESALLAMLGGALGVVLIYVGLDSLVAVAPPDIPLLEQTRVDPVVLGFAAAATIFATLFFGLLPALRVTATDLQSTLRAGGERSGTRNAGLRSALLISEVALCVVLLVGAGLLVRSFVRLQTTDLGFNSENLFVAWLNLPAQRYESTPDHVDFFTQLLERTAALPGVTSVSGTSEPPVLGYNMTFGFAIEGKPSGDADGREDAVSMSVVGPDFFRTMGIPLISGRVLDARDRSDAAAVVVINEQLAQRHWPGEDPIGHRISFQGPEGPDWFEIVGVVGGTRSRGADRPAEPGLYVAQAQKPWNWLSWLTIIARTDGEPLALGPAFRNAVSQLDDRLAIDRMTTVDDLYAESHARRRFAATLVAGFAALALLLGAMGIYGVLSYSVAQRTREIGVRMALGARRAAVAAAVVRHALTLAAGGVAIGLAVAFALSGLLGSLVFGVSTTDPVTFVAVPLVLTIVAAVAAYVPARRATLVDPTQALRSE
jgi:predicted permease